MARKTALITGATGFVGVNLVSHLVDRDWDVTVLHRANSNLTPLDRFPIQKVEGSLEDGDRLIRAVPENLDALFHVAGETSMWRGDRLKLWRTNVYGTRNIAKAAIATGCKKFVHTSTSGVFGLPSIPFDETSVKLGKGSFYYQNSKTLAEEEIQKAVARGLDAVILNPANIIGRYDWDSWSRFIEKVARRQMPLIPPGSACFCDVDAVVKAHVAAVTNGRKGENYLLGGERASYLDIVRLVGKLLGRPTNHLVANPRVFRLAGKMLDRISTLVGRELMMTEETAAFLSSDIICRSDKARAQLDYKPAPLDTMFRFCIEWMVADGRL